MRKPRLTLRGNRRAVYRRMLRALDFLETSDEREGVRGADLDVVPYVFATNNAQQNVLTRLRDRLEEMLGNKS